MKKKIAIIMGSESDLPIVEEALKILKDFSVGYDVKVLSAHRTPDLTSQYAKRAESNGIEVIIAAAGMAAALPGVIASHTNIPVIGIPIETKTFKGVDSLLSIVQMPGGIPVATMSVGKSGAKNAAIFALEILALKDKNIKRKLVNFRKKQISAIKKIKVKI
ncbi:MAG: 5-(carboxyamino)imidazole ribonucleotide mutase [Candidatus Omnitrophica bacterium]|nr:5-(carboxyamino)imidazole ribonucleotide mutase [Candidatus Omnitrophota bacterium]HOX54491.1 5-(carboxyamino)imidazole ribonucleotide mutase [Candidatus Omnitrophota bacterium]